MPTTPHSVIKPEKLVNTAVGVLEREAVLPRLVARESVDQYKGADNDTITYKVEGTLPYREYTWRSDRTEEITVDEYNERKVDVSFGGHVYSAVKCIDEQADFDLDKWGTLLTPQAKAVAAGITHKVRDAIIDAPYEVVIGDAEGYLRGALIEARRVLNAFKAPTGGRTLLVGPDFESAMLNDEKLTFASVVGDDIADSVLREATLGRHAGFTVVVDQELPGDTAIAFATSAFLLATAAPSVPSSLADASTISFNGFGLRWLKQYEAKRFQDLSVVDCYAGSRHVVDPLAYWNGTNQVTVTNDEHFVRAIKLELGGTNKYPAVGSNLALATGISSAKAWTPPATGGE